MDKHTCEALVVTCIDFRFQKYINDWVKENLGDGNYDRVAFAGGVKSLDTILSQCETSKKLHHIHHAYLFNHEDCGVYGESGTAEKHTQDLKEARAKLKEQFPDLAVDTYYLHLDGTFEKIN